MRSATRGARDLIVGRQVKQTFPQLSPEQTCDMRPVQLDQIEGVEEHAGIMPVVIGYDRTPGWL